MSPLLITLVIIFCFVATVIVIDAMFLWERSIYVFLKEKCRKKFYHARLWWSWKKARWRCDHWLKKNLYPPRYHLEYQSLILVAIATGDLYIESLDPSPDERARLGKINERYHREYVEKNCTPLDPTLIR